MPALSPYNLTPQRPHNSACSSLGLVHFHSLALRYLFAGRIIPFLISISVFPCIIPNNLHIIMPAQLAQLHSLVMFLTQPLIQSRCPPTAIMTFHSKLSLNLSPFFTPEVRVPFSFTLSSASLPPPPIYKAIIAAGVAWRTWCNEFCARYNGQDVEILVCPLEVKLRPVGTDVIYMVWARKPAERQYLEVPSQARSNFGYRLPSYEQPPGLVLTGNTTQPGGMVVPSLFVTPPASPPSLSRPLSAPSSSSSSDSESETSSSPPTSPESVPSDLPAVEETSKPSLPEPEAPRLTRRERRKFIDRSKAQSTHYLYQGGATNVVGGGVMLGGVLPRLQPRSPPKPSNVNAAKMPSNPTLPRKPDTSANWRQRS